MFRGLSPKRLMILKPKSQGTLDTSVVNSVMSFVRKFYRGSSSFTDPPHSSFLLTGNNQLCLSVAAIDDEILAAVVSICYDDHAPDT